MKRPAVNTSAAWASNHHRNSDTLAIAAGGGVVPQHIKATRDEVDELHLGYRAHSHHRRAASRTYYRGFRDGRIDHPPVAEAIQKAFRDFESASVYADVFAEKKDAVIALHLFPDSLSYRFK
jgi:hypothetical protein